VIPMGNVKMVQSPNKGVIKELYVKEGDFVEQGQTLLLLDTTKTQADVDQLRKQVAYYDMTVKRLQAEMNDEVFVPPVSDDLDKKDVEAQTALYQSRRVKLAADQEKNAATIAQEQAAIQSAMATQQKYLSMLEVAKEKEARLEELYRTDAVSYFQLLEARQTRVDYQKSAEAVTEEIAKERAKLAEAMDNQATTDSAYRQETMTQLVEAKKELNTYQEELTKATETNAQSVITAPVSGRVNQLAVHTVGGVVSEAQSLMMVVPDDAFMEVEVYADNKDIGFIEVGQEAEVKVETFNFQKFGMVNAEVMEISPDAIEDPQDKDKDKKYRLYLSVEKDDSGITVQPGMNVTAEIKIKKKRIIDFFLDPFRQYQDEALRER
ncbi:MAG: HlyD family type I secretion periplasmic adaptor subunit, partial [Selenomonadaceae bacterium]|nr:HlyD family type I secretion periplasmic adaptor subunit [Selenomonadaceae bacterium]